jgi:hypothetical protein
MHRRPCHEYGEAADVELAKMRSQSNKEQALDNSWRRIATHAPCGRRALLVIALPAIAYTTGNLVIKSELSSLDYICLIRKLMFVSVAHAASIFGGLGYDATQSLHLLAGIYVAAIAGKLIPLTYVDRIP